ncbi:hypothetical protein [Mangrovibacterium marinum]|uniref:Uncharacterized protein n=1 Tax=Mangrovibacterium marinum TaxID=1639118 RepID=A0A2T5BX58_9BACT|nr:hypothetical protein [Mangrovibacterium marinum]PTN04348.1 hypothetical protein C8N47_13222 [Mangrovibacterium marinum]
MAEKEIALLKTQVEKLNQKSFDLEAWKNQSLLFLNRIFGASHPIVKMILELKYDYSSWHLRDATGNEKLDDPVKMQAREILDAAIMELETLGLPGQAGAVDRVRELLQQEMTGKQWKELADILADKTENQTAEINEKLGQLSKEQLIDIVTGILNS